MTPDEPTLGSALRDQAFEEIERVATLSASYARSLAEAAYRGDALTIETHLKQLRLCCIAMIKTYKEWIGDADGPAARMGPEGAACDMSPRAGDAPASLSEVGGEGVHLGGQG